MQLSIIIPTINRRIELEELLNSIQNYVIDIPFEVIIVDQNPSGFLHEIINKFKEILNISHHLVSFKGLSKAKNYGAKKANGEYLTFPDDDCKIFPETYSKALGLMVSKNVDIVFGRCIDASGYDSVLNFNKQSYILNKNNMVGGFVEATGVIHKSIFEKDFYFDEKMGAGCFHGAEEGYDWLYRIFSESDVEAYYCPSVIYYHPQVLLDKGSDHAIKRAFTYSCGNAYLCKKHKFYARYFKRLTLVVFSIPVYLFINQKKAKYYFSELLGLLSGVIID
jgi:glycosyltransferase involved in cell wall biosynthesis